MTEPKKKCWREKVTAEIAVTHVLQFAHEVGTELSAAEVAEFLNQDGLAQNVWMHMMRAGEQYIKFNLRSKAMAMPPRHRTGTEARMIQ
jgi:hypothetical protein